MRALPENNQPALCLRRVNAKTSPSHGPGAFTLIEILASMSVLLILVLALTGAFNQVTMAWTRGSGDTERRRSARTLADFIGSELRAAQLPVETLAAAGSSNLQLLINPPAAQIPDTYRFADALFWQAPIATETTFGDMAEIGYFVKWDDGKPVLCRFFVNPSIASAPDPANPSAPAAMEPNPNYKIYTPLKPNDWLSATLLDTVAPANKKGAYVGLFAENVVGLWIRAYRLDGTELPRTFDSRTGYPHSDFYLDSTGKRKTRTETRYLPARINISLIELDSVHAQRLAPVASQIQSLTRDPKIVDATGFLKALTVAGKSSSAMAALLPGVRIYTTEVFLENAR